MSNIADEDFAFQLASQCKTHEAWLAIMRFGMGTLLQNQPLLMHLIVNEAEKEARLDSPPSPRIGSVARRLLDELGLRLVATS